MKRLLFTSIMVMTAWMGVNAMSYELAREEALYLTDKMAYELNLNDQQYNDAYEINLDYLMSLETADDIAGQYLDWRAADLRAILYDWQWSLFIGADYFLRPALWRAGSWFFPIYRIYDRHYFFYDRPRVFWDYRGGHGHFYFRDHGFYGNRRPHWNGGLRGNDRHGITRTPGMGAPRVNGEMRGGQISRNGGRSGNYNRNERNGNYNRSGNLRGSQVDQSTRSGNSRGRSTYDNSNSTRSDNSRGRSTYDNRSTSRSGSLNRGSSNDNVRSRSYQYNRSRSGNSFNNSSTRTTVGGNRGSSSYQNRSSRSSSSMSRGSSSIGRSSSSISRGSSSIGRGSSSIRRGSSSMGRSSSSISRGSSSMSRGSMGGGITRGGGGSHGGGSRGGGRGGR